MREVGQSLGIPVYVFGPETHMTAIVGMALGKRPIQQPEESESTTANFLLAAGQVQVSFFISTYLYPIHSSHMCIIK